MIGRIKIQPDDGAHFLDEERVVGELEVAPAVRLHPEQVEPALHGRFRDAGLFGHGASAPMGGVARPGLKGGVDDLGDPLVPVDAGAARTQFIVQPFDAVRQIPQAPLAGGLAVHPHTLDDRGVGFAFAAGEHDLRSPHDPVRRGARADDAAQPAPFVVIENNGPTGRPRAMTGLLPWIDTAAIIPSVSGSVRYSDVTYFGKENWSRGQPVQNLHRFPDQSRISGCSRNLTAVEKRTSSRHDSLAGRRHL